MASTDIINLIIEATTNALAYLLPVIAVLAGLNFLLTFLFSVVFRRS